MHSLAPPVSFAISNPLLGLFEQPSPITVLVGKLVSRIAPKMNLPAGEVKVKLVVSRSEVEGILADPLVYNAFGALGSKCSKPSTKCYAPKYTFCQTDACGDDQICDPDAGRKIASNFGTQGGGKLELVGYPKCYHELFNEVEKYDAGSDQRVA